MSAQPLEPIPPPPAPLKQAHPFPGRLLVVEGIDGSGKSTQLQLFAKYLQSRGQKVFLTEWNSSQLVKQSTRRGKKTQSLTPTTFSLLHATDFADRLVTKIVPPLKAGMVVLADRYAFTAFARDVGRGVDPVWIRNLYAFAYRPDATFYFRVPVEISLQRLLVGRAKLKYYEAGMDLGLTPAIQDSFRIFQGRVIAEYDRMVDEYGFQVIDATRPIPEQQREVREIIDRLFSVEKKTVPPEEEK